MIDRQKMVVAIQLTTSNSSFISPVGAAGRHQHITEAFLHHLIILLNKLFITHDMHTL